MPQTVNLTEHIHPKMDILFVALNASVKSNCNGQWFSGSLNSYHGLI